MKSSIKNLIVGLCLVGGVIGITFAQEAVAEESVNTFNVNGEFSTDITMGDAITFGSSYTGLVFTGDGWELSTNLSDGDVIVEEAKYSWAVTEAITLTFGSQAEPYGLAWGLHRPSNNLFVSSPREHTISNGVGFSTEAYGVGVDAFYGGSTEDVVDSLGVVTEEGSQHWGTRISYGITLLGIDSKVGLSVNSNDAQLIDVSAKGKPLGIPFETSFELDLAAENEDGEKEASYWLRSSLSPEFAKGAFALVGYNSDEEVLYGVGYKCTDNFFLSLEFSSEDEEEKDMLIRASYSF